MPPGDLGKIQSEAEKSVMSKAFILAASVLVILGVSGWAMMTLWLRDADGRGRTGVSHSDPGDGDMFEVEHTDYHRPAPEQEEVLSDDRITDKHPVFDPKLVDRRPLGANKEWLVNSSAAVLRLDVPMILPDQEPQLLNLHASYAAAILPYPEAHNILPSVNLLDGKAKQFDDGLYAALDLAYYQGLRDALQSHVQLVRRLYDRVGRDSLAAPYLAAGLELARVAVEPANRQAKADALARFRADEFWSKPIGFYTWNERLADCFRFLRFFQVPFGPGELQIPKALAAALAQEPALLADYHKALAFYAHVTNPLDGLSVADLVGKPALSEQEFVALCHEKHVPQRHVALFASSQSREVLLFEKLFPLGLPPDANLMRELVRSIRSGKVDLAPRADSGWYEYQVYALETLLLPEKGQENSKLLLTKAYKKRMLEAFQALITKRRETHVRQLAGGMKSEEAPPRLPDKIKPRLRVEPCPSYFIRTARAYAFLNNFLESALGKTALQGLHGLKQSGQRQQNLDEELGWMRDLFYGLHLISAEDIGMKPALTADEPVDLERCYTLAEKWLAKAFTDEDLAVDTRVAVPIYVETDRTRLWVTLGVRLSRLNIDFVQPPSLSPAQGNAAWQPVEGRRLEGVSWLIPVDEFAEVELLGRRVLSREELRAVCDRAKTREAIVQELQK
jgi:hypothetical protein